MNISFDVEAKSIVIVDVEAKFVVDVEAMLDIMFNSKAKGRYCKRRMECMYVCMYVCMCGGEIVRARKSRNIF
jgi:hypothetical protein